MKNVCHNPCNIYESMNARDQKNKTNGSVSKLTQKNNTCENMINTTKYKAKSNDKTKNQ